MSIKCDLCKKKPAKLNMKNQVNGNQMKICLSCHRAVWGRERK